MISVCTKVEIKFEREVENKQIGNNELKLISDESWKKKLFFLNSRKINAFLENLVEFY